MKNPVPFMQGKTISATTFGAPARYHSIFSPVEIGGHKKTMSAIPPAISATLKRFGIEAEKGNRWPVEKIDMILEARKASLDDRLMVKSCLRQIDAIE